MMIFRKELKYNINNYEFSLINEELKRILKKDKYCIGDHYTITSIYFDNYKGQAYNQVKCGLSERWKYRIRFYNYDDGFIKKKKKYKINNLTNKQEALINREIYEKILSGKVRVSKDNSKLLNEFIIAMKTQGLRPIICIEYDRIPYVYKVDNVRITLDYNIKYTDKINDLFSKNKKMYYLNEKVLEIKYNELIPDFILKKININHLNNTSFSKFLNSIESNKGGNIYGTKDFRNL